MAATIDRRLGPQVIDQHVGVDYQAVIDQQQRQQRPGLATPWSHINPVGNKPERTEKASLHSHGSGRYLQPLATRAKRERHESGAVHPCAVPPRARQRSTRKADSVKYVLEYSRQLGTKPNDNIDAGLAVLQAFHGWTAPDGLTVSEFAVRADGRGGVVVCTADDLAPVYLFVMQYAAWFNWDVIPVLDVNDAAATFGTGLEWARNTAN